MISLRHKQSWLVWIVAVTLVITGVFSPAQAFACAERPAQVQTAQAASQSKQCASMSQKASCCCKPGEKLSGTHASPLGAVVTASGCGCAVHAPDTSPAPATKASALVFAPEVAFHAGSSPVIELPQSAPWLFAAPSTGPPLAPLRSTGPSRAPPTG